MFTRPGRAIGQARRRHLGPVRTISWRSDLGDILPGARTDRVREGARPIRMWRTRSDGISSYSVPRCRPVPGSDPGRTASGDDLHAKASLVKIAAKLDVVASQPASSAPGCREGVEDVIRVGPWKPGAGVLIQIGELAS